jgi:hypothetical protein
MEDKTTIKGQLIDYTKRWQMNEYNNPSFATSRIIKKKDGKCLGTVLPN